jgi:inosine/xanthosine triphosphate pyrophosphatase family protein
MTMDEKSDISHRGLAVNGLVEFLENMKSD